MKRRPLIAGGITCAVIVAALFHLGASTHRSAESSALETVRVVRRNVGTAVKATGVIKPQVGAEVRVGSRLSGVVNRLYVQVGDAVTKGQRLAELDDRDLAARRNEASASLQRSLAELRFAESDLRRKRTLQAQQAISAEELDLSERACAVAEQGVAVCRAGVAFADTQLDFTRIVAPIGGVVASVATQEGETVSAGFAAPTFVTLIDLGRLEVWAYVDETDIGRIEVGQKARFTVDTYGDQEFEGVVTAIYPKAEIRDNVVNYITVVRFEPPAGRVLRPEMTTTVRIAVAVSENVPALPLRVVGWDAGRAFVRVALPGGGFERRAVTTGRRDAEFVEITAGVAEGDAVLVEALKGDKEP